MNKETSIQNKIRIHVTQLGARAWRNNVGKAWQGKSQRTSKGHIVIENPQRVEYGLCVGSSDLIGLVPVVITEDMIGKTVAVFMALEVKTERGRTSKEQRNYIELVNKMGGIAGVVRSEEDAERLVRSWG